MVGHSAPQTPRPLEDCIPSLLPGGDDAAHDGNAPAAEDDEEALGRRLRTTERPWDVLAARDDGVRHRVAKCDGASGRPSGAGGVMCRRWGGHVPALGDQGLGRCNEQPEKHREEQGQEDLGVGSGWRRGCTPAAACHHSSLHRQPAGAGPLYSLPVQPADPLWPCPFFLEQSLAPWVELLAALSFF